MRLLSPVHTGLFYPTVPSVTTFWTFQRELSSLSSVTPRPGEGPSRFSFPLTAVSKVRYPPESDKAVNAKRDFLFTESSSVRRRSLSFLTGPKETRTRQPPLCSRLCQSPDGFNCRPIDFTGCDRELRLRRYLSLRATRGIQMIWRSARHIAWENSGHEVIRELVVSFEKRELNATVVRVPTPERVGD